MFASTRLALAAAFTALAFTGAPFVTPARAANELCGQTITQNVTLTADQSCTGDGVVVGADGVTIDLAGFTISGDGGAGDVGIDVANRSKVKIRNGTVRNFGTGIFSDGGDAEGLQVTNLTARDNGRGGFLSVCSGKVRRSSFIGNSNGGLELDNLCSKAVAVDASAFVGNGGVGLQLLANGKAKATKLIVNGNENDGVLLAGVNVSLQSSTIAANGGEGVQVFLAASGCAVRKNVIVGNGGDGMLVDATFLDQPGQNALTANLIAGNRGNGIRVLDDGGATFELSKNRLIGNSLNGARIESAGGITVTGNTATGNGIDGVATTNAVTLLAKNVANANGGRGIFAPMGLDGGGNTARANVGAPCSGTVACPAPFTSKVGSAIPVCGLHITSSITVGADSPLCADKEGLFIDGDDITVDLNGHRILGDRTPNRFGIIVSGKNVTLTNGIVQGFGIGISSGQPAAGLKLVNVEVRDSVNLGVFLGGINSLVSKSVIVNNSGPGLILDGDAAGTVVSSTFVVGNTGDGLRSRTSGGTITGLTSAGNVGVGALLYVTGDGKLQNATVARNLDDGIRVAPAFGALAPSVVKKSLVVGNDLNGIVLSSNSVAMTLDSNFVGGNGNDGIVLTGAPQQTIVKRNSLVGNLSDGLFIDVAVGPTSLVQNRAVGNLTTGLNVAAATTTLAKNAALGNSGFGIATPFGAIDGGGNVAADNVGPDQCTVPIVCE